MTPAQRLRLRFLAVLSGGVTMGGVAALSCTSKTAEKARPEAPGPSIEATPRTAPNVAAPNVTAPSVTTSNLAASSVPAPSIAAPSTATPLSSAPGQALPATTPTEPVTKAALTPSCGSLSGAVECFAPGSTHFNPGNVRSPAPPPPARFDANRCQVREEVRNGCCNAALSGPALINGECCYGFCTGVCCGRPLVVGGAARVAAVTARADWSGALDLDLSDLGERERRELARQWLSDARMEHASIASFARFALDLLAFGAPADLLERCQRALGDEIRHARHCFALASTYSGRAYGPAPLDLSGVTPSATLADAAAAAVREGCLNETIAALTAAEQAEGVTNPVLRATLEGIAHDEAEHAELAWRFVAWAIQVGGTAVKGAVASALAVPPFSAVADVHEPDLRAYGRLDGAASAAVARTAWTDVILPCSQRLLEPICAAGAEAHG